MKALLALAVVAALALPAAAAPAPATVDAAARELPREQWQRAVTHAKRLHDAVKDEAATRDYADDQPPATGFEGSPARRRKVQRQATLRRAPAAFTAEPDLRDAPNSGAPAAPKVLPAAEPLPGLDASLARAIKPVQPARRPDEPVPVAQRGPQDMPTLDQAWAPLIGAELPGASAASAVTPGQTAACAAPRPGAKRGPCSAPRGI